MLTIIKGNSLEALVSVAYESGEAYQHTSTDRVFFSVSTNHTDSPVIQKELTYDTEQDGYLLELVPEDTDDLVCYPDEAYWFDIALQTTEGFYTIIPCTEFRVERAISRKVV